MQNIKEDKLVSRFLFREDIRQDPNTNAITVRFSAFLPRELKTSVFRIDGLSEDDIWKIGEDEVAAKRVRTLRGRTDKSTEEIYSLELTIEPETSCHPLHADIASWPDSALLQQEKATILAADAVFAEVANIIERKKS